MSGYVYRGTEFDAKPRMGRVPRPFDPALCGTEQGVWQHRRMNQTNCPKCKTAYNAKRREQRNAKKEGVSSGTRTREDPNINLD